MYQIIYCEFNKFINLSQNVCLDPGKVLFRFAVKFYAADPVQLQEEQTRY